MFYRSGAHKVSSSQTWFTDSRVCPVIAKVIATFEMVFQNEANLNLSFRKKIFSFLLGVGSGKAVTVTAWLHKPSLRRRHSSLPRGASPGGGGWSSGLSLEGDFSSAGTDTCLLFC